MTDPQPKYHTSFMLVGVTLISSDITNMVNSAIWEMLCRIKEKGTPSELFNGDSFFVANNEASH